MLAIKLKRTGKKHQAFYRMVVAERRSKMRGVFTDDLGWVNPHNNEDAIDKEKVLHWLKVGAKPTDTVHNLLVRLGVIKEEKIAVHKKSKKAPEVAAAEVAAPVATAAPAPVVEVKEVPTEAAAPAVPKAEVVVAEAPAPVVEVKKESEAPAKAVPAETPKTE